jgi:para-aminobenzoate synthetase component I
LSEWIHQMNVYGKEKIPFLFILDFELKIPKVIPLKEVPRDVFYKFNQIKNYELSGKLSKTLEFKKFPMSFEAYQKGFDLVKSEILYGNSFLLNLTYPTEIKTNFSLRELFNIAQARYKLYYKNKFIVSSPEIFVQIKEGKIITYPMKGTIDASIPDAEHKILADIKETAEHYTIVDLLRNDLSQIATQVTVERFRYIETLHTLHKSLVQVSSEITGVLPEEYYCHLGTIFSKLLPAGSISGAPKKKTVEIIRNAEIESRGYYTGIMGIYDGVNVDSGVMIRYIENKNGQMYYRSGCGITCMSEARYEYDEMIDKVYIPYRV